MKITTMWGQLFCFNFQKKLFCFHYENNGLNLDAINFNFGTNGPNFFPPLTNLSQGNFHVTNGRMERLQQNLNSQYVRMSMLLIWSVYMKPGLPWFALIFSEREMLGSIFRLSGVERPIRQSTARILTEQRIVQVCMRSGSTWAIRTEMNDWIDGSARA